MRVWTSSREIWDRFWGSGSYRQAYFGLPRSFFRIREFHYCCVKVQNSEFCACKILANIIFEPKLWKIFNFQNFDFNVFWWLSGHVEYELSLLEGLWGATMVIFEPVLEGVSFGVLAPCADGVVNLWWFCGKKEDFEVKKFFKFWFFYILSVRVLRWSLALGDRL